MKPPDFRYHLPDSVDSAVEMLATLDNARALAGGQSLMPMLNMRFVHPDHLVDLNRVPGLSGLSRVGDAIRIGATTRQRVIEFDPGIARDLPLLQEAVLNVGHRQTRNRGTLGGSLCHLDPAAELVAASMAYDAVVEVAGKGGRREIAFADFALGFMTPAIDVGEIVVGVRFTPWPRPHGHAFVEFARRHGDFAIVSSAVLLEEDGDGRIARASLTVGGVAQTAVRLREAEAMLVGERASPELFRAAAETGRSIEALDDVHVSAAYRRRLTPALTRRALTTAHERLRAQR